MDAQQYRDQIITQIQILVRGHDCQPILFFGAGLSRRYIGAPNWHDALREALKTTDVDQSQFDYYAQIYGGDPIVIGTKVAEDVREWAWKYGKSHFPPALFKSINSDIFLKYLVAQQLDSKLINIESLLSVDYKLEIDALRRVRAHAIITTNFDRLAETIFEGYEPIIGQRVLKYNTNSFGEIYKIHGCTSDVDSIVICQKDYDEFTSNKTYLSAKLLAYFAEHPIFVFGYSFNDPHIVAILSGVGKIVADASGLIPNVFYVQWLSHVDYTKSPQQEILIIGDTGNFRVRSITTESFEWIFSALAQNQELKSISTKLLRALAARAYKLVRTDLLKGVVEVDYKLLEGLANDDEKLPQLLGITHANNPNMSHPYSLTQVASQLGLKSWHDASKLIDKVHAQTGKNLRRTDNIYHCKILAGSKSEVRKWSSAAVSLLRQVQTGKKYQLKM